MGGDVVEQLVSLADSTQAAKSTIAGLPAEDLYAVGAGLKQRALFFLRRDAPQALAIASLILFISAPGARRPACAPSAYRQRRSPSPWPSANLRPRWRSLPNQKASTAYDDELEIAFGQISQVWALACLQRYDEAFATGEATAGVFVKYGEDVSLAALNNNLAAIYGRRGQDHQALQRIEEVEAAYGRLGKEGQRRLSLALINKAIVMRNLGRYEASLAANNAALHLAREQAQTANVARAEQNLGITHFLLGRFGEAQTLLERARDTFISDRRYRDAILAELFISDGLLHLGRYEEALVKCRQVIAEFGSAGTQFEVAQALLNKATALTGLLDYERALAALAKARAIFEQEANETWAVYTDLEKAAIYYRKQRYGESQRLAAAAIPHLQAHNLLLKVALARILAARAALAKGRRRAAQDHVREALAVAARDRCAPAHAAGLLFAGTAGPRRPRSRARAGRLRQGDS